MRLLPSIEMVAKLPFSLLWTSLALVATRALPVGSIELKLLTPDDFDSTVAKGVWFVEHFSPYCTHCKHFAPTWEKLTEHYESMESPGVHLAQVDCAANGDLCNKHDVKGYPQMNLYRDGEFVEQFKGARDLEKLTAFLDSRADVPQVPERIPDEVNLETPSNSQGTVLSLTPSNFDSVIAQGPTFVKFFAPWCGHCKKIAPLWVQLAAHMKGRLAIAEVDCDAHNSLCKTQGVQGFPTLAFFNGGSSSHKTEYSGGRKLEQLKNFAEKAVAPAVAEVRTDEQLDEYIREYPVLYLFLHAPADERALRQVKHASHLLLGSPLVLTSTLQTLRSRFQIPSSYNSHPVLLAIKDAVPGTYTSIFQFPASSASDADKDLLSSWLLSNRLPTFLELNQDNFQLVMNAPQQPLVVLVAANPSQVPEVSALVSDSANGWRGRIQRAMNGNGDMPSRDVIFTWMDAERWATWMKSMYGIKSSYVPAVVITDHQNLIYYDNDSNGYKIGVTKDSILESVDGVLQGRVKAKHSENIVERMVRYLNNTLISLENGVIAHPIVALLIGVSVVVAFVLAMKRFIASDVQQFSNGHDYSKVPKSQGRLD